VAFTNEQHRKRYAEDPQHREHKLAANRVYRAEHRERLNTLWRDKWRANAAYRERHALTRIERLYGLSPEQYRRLLKAQKGVCAICKRPPQYRALCVDHCRVTKRVRGLLCNNCNTGLGLFGDDPVRLRAAAAYLERARRTSERTKGDGSDLPTIGLGASRRPPPHPAKPSSSVDGDLVPAKKEEKSRTRAR
jgi:Recombination endonuclease VII